MVKPTIQKLPKPPIKPSAEQPKKKERKKRPTITDIHEGQLYINGQWLAVELCIVCALIAGFIVLILKLTGNLQ